jgi:hypothetical protein
MEGPRRIGLEVVRGCMEPSARAGRIVWNLTYLLPSEVLIHALGHRASLGVEHGGLAHEHGLRPNVGLSRERRETQLAQRYNRCRTARRSLAPDCAPRFSLALFFQHYVEQGAPLGSCFHVRAEGRYHASHASGKKR